MERSLNKVANDRKKEYVKARAKVICFTEDDIIVASGSSDSCKDTGYSQCPASNMNQGCKTNSYLEGEAAYKRCRCASYGLWLIFG